MSKGKAIVDKALQNNGAQAQPESTGASSSRHSAKDADRQPTLIHWFLENPVPSQAPRRSDSKSGPVTGDVSAPAGPASHAPAPGRPVETPQATAPSEARAEPAVRAKEPEVRACEVETTGVEPVKAEGSGMHDHIARLEAEKEELQSLVSELRAEKQLASDYRSSVLVGKDREIKQLKRQLADLESEVLRLNRVLDQKDRDAQVVAGNLRDRDAFLSALKRTGFFRRAFGWRHCFIPPS